MVLDSSIAPESNTNANPGIHAKVENQSQYEQYLEELEPLRKELGIELKEVLYPKMPLSV